VLILFYIYYLGVNVVREYGNNKYFRLKSNCLLQVTVNFYKTIYNKILMIKRKTVGHILYYKVINYYD